MSKIDMSNKDYLYFRSTLDHLWLTDNVNVFKLIEQHIDLNTLDDVKKRYLLGFRDYITNRNGIKCDIEFDISTLDIGKVKFTEGAEELIAMFGEKKAIEIINSAIVEFKRYGIIVNSVLMAK